jgi:hypothetical protein
MLLQNKTLTENVTEILLSFLDKALQNDPVSSELYFAILTSLLISKDFKTASSSLSLPPRRQRGNSRSLSPKIEEKKSED